MATINVDDTENLEKAIKRFKRMVEKEGIIREYKKRVAHYCMVLNHATVTGSQKYGIVVYNAFALVKLLK